LITLLFAMIFKFLPDAKIAWHDVWIGAFITALLFTIGKFALGLYLGKSGVSSSYGAAGSLIVLLLWVYYSSQILFFGAEFTQVYSNRFGSHVALPTMQLLCRSMPRCVGVFWRKRRIAVNMDILSRDFPFNDLSLPC